MLNNQAQNGHWYVDCDKMYYLFLINGFIFP